MPRGDVPCWPSRAGRDARPRRRPGGGVVVAPARAAVRPKASTDSIFLPQFLKHLLARLFYTCAEAPDTSKIPAAESGVYQGDELGFNLHQLYTLVAGLTLNLRAGWDVNVDDELRDRLEEVFFSDLVVSMAKRAAAEDGLWLDFLGPLWCNPQTPGCSPVPADWTDRGAKGGAVVRLACKNVRDGIASAEDTRIFNACSRGGLTTAAKMTPEQLRKRAQKGGQKGGQKAGKVGGNVPKYESWVPGLKKKDCTDLCDSILKEMRGRGKKPTPPVVAEKFFAKLDQLDPSYRVKYDKRVIQYGEPKGSGGFGARLLQNISNRMRIKKPV